MVWRDASWTIACVGSSPERKRNVTPPIHAVIDTVYSVRFEIWICLKLFLINLICFYHTKQLKVVVSFHTDDRFSNADIAWGWNCRRVYFDAAVDQFPFFSFWKCARKHHLKLVLFLLHIVVLPHIPSPGSNIVPLALLRLVEVSSLERKICCSLFGTPVDNKILEVAKVISPCEPLTYFSSK